MTTDLGDAVAAGRETDIFAGREGELSAFRRILAAPGPAMLKVVAYHGRSGLGKSALLGQLGRELDAVSPPAPHAYYNLENLRTPTSAAREALLHIRCELESRFDLSFPRFDMLLCLLVAGDGGTPPALVARNPALKETFDLATSFLGLSADKFSELLKVPADSPSAASPTTDAAGGREEILDLRARVRREDPTLADELIDRFASDLVSSLPARDGRACRGVLFFDAVESLWKGADAAHSAHSRQLDYWLRRLALRVNNHGVLIVIAGRDKSLWAQDEPWWQNAIENRAVLGLNRESGQSYLAQRSIGSEPPEAASPLQAAILDVAADDSGLCDPFLLALCAETVINSRAKNAGADPPASTFVGLPKDQVTPKLTDRYLKSIPDRRLESWVKELSLTPAFDEQTALELDKARHHNLGRPGWKKLLDLPFVEPRGDGLFRLQRTMRDALRTRLGNETVILHRLFRKHWHGRKQPALNFFHRWSLEPETTLNDWVNAHKSAMKDLRFVADRALLDDWAEVPPEGIDRRQLGDGLWARTHFMLAESLRETQGVARLSSLSAAIGHYESALGVYTRSSLPSAWAAALHGLGTAYREFPAGDRADNLRRAIACYDDALNVRTETDCPTDWAATQNGLGCAYRDLTTGDRAENLRRAITCFEWALRVYSERNQPSDWAATQTNLGHAWFALSTGDRADNLTRAIACYKAALRVYTESRFPSLWAATQNSLGIAYRNLTGGEPGENLRRAISCYEKALEVHTEAGFPALWAMVQNNLGIAYRNLPDGDRSENLRHAIGCFEAALRVRTEKGYPLDWAATQYNLGNAYRIFPSGDRSENLRRALAHYAAALRVYTEKDYPSAYASTQRNLELAMKEFKASGSA